MAENSHISWTDHTFNGWIGCTKISPACDGCYAAHLMGGGRYNRVTWGEPGKGEGTRSRTAPSTWKLPRKWNKKAAENPGKTFVFCSSLADVFDNAVPPEWRRDLFELIRETPNLTWLLLTKRIGNAVKMSEAAGGFPWNAALGATMANQMEYDRDRTKLHDAREALGPRFTFGSFEPLLGRVILDRFAPDWIITGGETDQGAHKARPARPDWYRHLRDQSRDLGRVFHFKQWGEWVSVSEAEGAGEHFKWEDGATVRKIGKHNDPCTLDGVAHFARPAP